MTESVIALRLDAPAWKVVSKVRARSALEWYEHENVRSRFTYNIDSGGERS